MYKMFLLGIIITILFVILVYAKNIILYHPSPKINDKYEHFYRKLNDLVNCENYIQKHRVLTHDQIELDVIHIQNPDLNQCIIFFHGNAGNISMRFDIIKFLYNYASIIVFDYRSYGDSTGDSSNLSALSLQIDARAVWNFAVNHIKIKPTNISLMGESLGCAVALELAANLSRTFDPNLYPHSLILNSPFSSLSSMIEVMFGRFNLKFVGKILSMILGGEYQSDELIKLINHRTKIIIAHSLRDEIIPIKEGLKLSKSGTHPNIKFINITGTHNNMGLTDTYIYALADLFN